MGKSLNKATIIGHAGKDAEVRYTGTGTAVASFSVATTESWKDKNSGQTQEKTEWHNVVAWDRLGEICGEWVKKGTQVYIEGRIQNRSYDDKDGNKRYTSEIVAKEMILLGSKRGSDGGSGGSGGDYNQAYGAPSGGGFGTRNNSANNAAAPVPVPDFEPASEDDLPF